MSNLRMPRTAGRVLERIMTRPSRQGALTAYERDLDPIYDEEMEEELRRRRRIQPLRKVFDILQIGQFVSANVADELINAVMYAADRGQGDPWKPGDIIRAIGEGITGKRKGTYENILRDTLGVGKTKLFPGAPEGKRRAQLDWADLIGFIGDVALDPFTWISPAKVIFGGASKGAQIAASNFADDAVRMFGKQLAQNPEQLAKLTRSRWAQEAVEKALSADNVTKAFKSLSKGTDDLGRTMSGVYKEAYQRALNRTSQQLPDLAQEIAAKAGAAPGGIEDIAKKAAAGGYEHAGERYTSRVLGTEFGIRQPGEFADWRRRSWETFTNFVKQKPGVVSARNALYAVMNKGPIGEIRRVMGFRNPYQKFLRNIEREQGEFAVTQGAMDRLQEAWAPLAKLSDDQLDQALKFMSLKEDKIREAALRYGPGTKLEDIPMWRATVGEGIDKEAASAAWDLKMTLDSWQERASDIAEELGESQLSHYEWYIPEIFRFRRGGPSSRMTREYTFSQQQTKESKMLQFVFGIDEDMANTMLQRNLAGLSVDLKEMVSAKALQQAKVEARYNMVKTFREFGIPLDEMREAGGKLAEYADALQMGGREIPQLGVRQLDHPGLQGYLFDRDVADIMERALAVTGKDRTKIGKLFASYMNWWKGMVLLTSGYSLRNHYSNTMTQFLRHGARAFNPKEIQQSIAAVAYIMKKTDPKNLTKVLDSIGKNEGWLNSMLNTRIGPLGRELRELAEESYRRGVISENLFGFDATDIVEKIAGRTKQPIRSLARKGNTFIESVPRFQSFLIDYSDNVGSEAAEAGVMDWSARQARQWFMDYGDLTEAEQRFAKKVIPFYTWIRKNLANQINGIALYPELYGLIPKIENVVTYENPDYDPALIPDWMRNEAMFAIGEPEEGKFRMFRPDFAYQDINMLPFLWEEGRLLPYFNFNEMKNELINASAPWIRWFAGKITTENGYNFFYREELGETGDAPYLMRLFLSRPGTIAFVDGLMRMLGSEDGAKMHLDENGKLQMDAQMAQTLETYIPVLRQVEMLFYLPNAIIPGFEQAIEQSLGAKDDYDGAEQWMQLMAYYLGIKTKDVDLAKEKERLGWDIFYRSRELLTEQRRMAPGAELRRQQSRARTQASIRRLGG